MEIDHDAPKLVHAEFRPRHQATKSRREPYVRQFPGRLSYLLGSLKDWEFVAMSWLQLAFVLRDGDLPADDKLLATVTKLSVKSWALLRDKLLALGLARIEDGMWIDEDQERSLEMQRNSRLRAQRGGRARWAGKHES